MISSEEKLAYFIDLCYNGNASKFARIADLKNSVVSRWLHGGNPSIRQVEKVYNAGLNVSWLFSMNDEELSIFADNEIGRQLRNKYEKKHSKNFVDNISDSKNYIYERAITWINENFGSLKNFCEEKDLEYFEWHNVFMGSHSIKPEMAFVLSDAGCNMQYIISGNGFQYNDTESAKILQAKKIHNMTSK